MSRRGDGQQGAEQAPFCHNTPQPISLVAACDPASLLSRSSACQADEHEIQKGNKSQEYLHLYLCMTLGSPNTSIPEDRREVTCALSVDESFLRFSPKTLKVTNSVSFCPSILEVSRKFPSFINHSKPPFYIAVPQTHHVCSQLRASHLLGPTPRALHSQVCSGASVLHSGCPRLRPTRSVYLAQLFIACLRPLRCKLRGDKDSTLVRCCTPAPGAGQLRVGCSLLSEGAHGGSSLGAAFSLLLNAFLTGFISCKRSFTFGSFLKDFLDRGLLNASKVTR